MKAKEEALNATLQASQKKMDAMAQSLKQAEAATKASPYVVLEMSPRPRAGRAKFEDAERRALDLESRLGGAEARAAGAEAAAETRQRIIDTLQSQKAGQAPPSPPPVPRSTQPRPSVDPTPLLQERSKVTTLQAEVKERDERLKALAAELEASKLTI